jgi:hypothetical protein
MAADSQAQNDPSAYCTAGPMCSINREIEVTDGSDVDFGNRIVNVAAIVSVRSGSMTIRAAELRILGDGQLNGNRGEGGGSFTVITDGDIRIDGTRQSGAVQVSGQNGGTLTLRSTSGRIFGAGSIVAQSQGDPLGDGGFIDIMTGGSVELTGRIDAAGGIEAAGGDVDVVATGDVSLTGLIDLQGGSDGGGTLSISSDGAVTLGEVQLDGRGEFGDGGALDLVAESVLLTGRIRGRGSNTPELCGDSGDLTVDVTGLLNVTGEIDVNSRRDCIAGTLDFSAGIASLRGPLRVRAEGSEGSAGSLTVLATERIECLAPVASIDGRGDDSGADVLLEVDSVEPTTETVVDCNVDLSGPAGSFEVDANTNVTIARAILVGPSGSASGPGPLTPLISIEGCTVRVGATAELTSRGTNASNLLIAREQAHVAGTLQAVVANEFRFRPGLQPVISGLVRPVPRFVEDGTLQSCGFATGTPTITRTGTVTRTPTRTPTPILGCVGDCNENGVVSVDELVLGIEVSLGEAPVSACPTLDRDGNGEADISENVTAVRNALNGCS